MKLNKHSIGISLAILAGVASQVSMAGQHIGSGLPPTPFEFDHAAIMTILENQDLRTNLRHSGFIKAISPVDRRERIYLISTDRCDLKVKFIVIKHPESPIPQVSSQILWDQSTGECQENR